MTRLSIAAAEITRTVVNVAASMRAGASANRHRIELAAKHTIAAAVSVISRKRILCATGPRATIRLSSRGRSYRPLDAVGETRGVVGDTRQEGRIHFREPWQAEEVDAGQGRDPAFVLRFAAGTQQRKFKPAEIEAVSGRPNQRAEAGAAHIELADRHANAW